MCVQMKQTRWNSVKRMSNIAYFSRQNLKNKTFDANDMRNNGGKHCPSVWLRNWSKGSGMEILIWINLKTINPNSTELSTTLGITQQIILFSFKNCINYVYNENDQTIWICWDGKIYYARYPNWLHLISPCKPSSKTETGLLKINWLEEV